MESRLKKDILINGSLLMKDREIKKYSEEFQLAVLTGLENGTYSSLADAARKNGITRYETVRRWAIKHNKPELIPKIVVIEVPKKTKEKK